MSCASKHPCYLCEAKHKDGKWEDDRDLRTTKSIVENKDKWIECGAKKVLAKEHLNCVASPLTTNDDMNETPMLLKSPPPSLHIKLGVNSILKDLQALWPDIDIFLKGLSLTFAPYHGETLGKDFNDIF